MKIRILSDIHTEFGGFTVPELPTDPETVLILAGDIGLAQKPYTYKEFIADNSLRFKRVIYIAGNHEHYNGKFSTTHNKIWNALLEFDNVDFIEKETVIVDNVAFIGATLWTDMNNHDVLTMETARWGMNDYRVIRHGPVGEPWKRKLRPMDTVEDHFQAKNFIFGEIKKHKSDGRKVAVITHHAPSFLSVPEEFRGDDLNGAYASELWYHLDDLGDDMQPELWCHGHIHTPADYTIGNTRVVCNPRGYMTKDSTDLTDGFDPLKLIEL